MVPALNEAISGKADENYDGRVTISEMARYVGGEMSDGAGSLLHTAGSVAASLTVSDAGQERPAEPVAVATPLPNSSPVVDSTPFRLRPLPMVVTSLGVASGLASVAMYLGRRGECEEYQGTLRCGEAGTDYEGYRTAQHGLGWAGGLLVASGLGVQVLAGPTQTGVSVGGHF